MTVASMIAAPQIGRWRPYLWGVASVAVVAVLVYLALAVSLRRMVAKVRAANPAHEQLLVAVTDDQWTRLGVDLSTLSGVRYAVVDVGAAGIRLFVGIGDPRLLTLIPLAGVLELEVATSRLGVVTRPALKIKRLGELAAIVLTPIKPSLRSYSSDEIASRIHSLTYAMGRPTS